MTGFTFKVPGRYKEYKGQYYAGVTYTNIKQPDEMAQTLLTVGLPTTYFVDSEGRILTASVRGANFDKYREKLEEALKAVE